MVVVLKGSKMIQLNVNDILPQNSVANDHSIVPTS